MPEKVLAYAFATVLMVSGFIPLLKWLLTDVGDFMKWCRTWWAGLKSR